MKTILIILLLAALALLAGLYIACAGLMIVVLVLLAGDIMQGLPESPCTHDCSQGDHCACMPDDRRHP